MIIIINIENFPENPWPILLLPKSSHPHPHCQAGPDNHHNQLVLIIIDLPRSVHIIILIRSAGQAEATLEVQHFRSLEEHKSWTRNLSMIRSVPLIIKSLSMVQIYSREFVQRLPRMRSRRMSTTTISSTAR